MPKPFKSVFQSRDRLARNLDIDKMDLNVDKADELIENYNQNRISTYLRNQKNLIQFAKYKNLNEESITYA